MAGFDIALQRLHNQGIAGTPFENPVEVVQWLGAVQAQDYAGAKWALGMRMRDATDDVIERAVTGGTILRTHILRPTWHFVAPVDIRWLQKLTAPRVLAASAVYYRRLELDDSTLARCATVIAGALQGGHQLTRSELASVLERSGIVTRDVRITFIVMRAELDGIICSGARRGKQFTYALLDERAPAAPTLTHDEALAELVRRYFFSHGPATVQDFVWWSGLTAADNRAGLEWVRSQLMHEVVDGQTYWFSASTPPTKEVIPTAYLLSTYDEYIVSYKDRGAVLDESRVHELEPRGNILFSNTIVIGGRVVGAWKRTLKKDAVVVASSPLTPLDAAESRALADAARRYGEFLGLPVTLV